MFFTYKISQSAGESLMIEVTLKSIRQDPAFELDILKFSSENESLKFTLEVPKGLLKLKKGSKALLNIGEEEDGDLVMKGHVYKVDNDSKRIEISFHGLWLRMTYKGPIPFKLDEDQEVYLVMKFSK